jgi:hypothetical protein
VLWVLDGAVLVDVVGDGKMKLSHREKKLQFHEKEMKYWERQRSRYEAFGEMETWQKIHDVLFERIKKLETEDQDQETGNGLH